MRAKAHGSLKAPAYNRNAEEGETASGLAQYPLAAGWWHVADRTHDP